MIAALAIFSFAMVVYAYFGYPIILFVLSRLGFGSAQLVTAEVEVLPSLTLIITVRNEAAVIAEKLESSLLLTYGETPFQIIVASDCSDDETDQIVGDFGSRGVALVRLKERGGKEVAQKAAIEAATGEVIVFTDAKIRLEPGALEAFAKYFSDPKVGAVSSIDKIEGNGGSGESMYIRYEMLLRRLESAFSSLVGLSGSCFAVRSEICSALQTNVPSDFALLIEAQKRGLRGVHGDDVIAWYKTVKTESEEFSRKVRTVLRGMSTLFSKTEVLNPLEFGSFAWQMASHKLCRWLVPWWILLGLICSVLLASNSLFFFVVSILTFFFFGLALAACIKPSLAESALLKLPLFFTLVNAAIFVAWLKYLSGQRVVLWDPSSKR